MNPSPASIGLAMIGFSLVVPAMAMRSGGPPLTALSVFAAAALLVGGVAMFLRRPAAFWIGLAGAVTVVLSAVAGMVLRREIGLPISPVLMLVIGLYATFRVSMTRSAFLPAEPRRSIADQLAHDLARKPAAPSVTTPTEAPPDPGAPAGQPPT